MAGATRIVIDGVSYPVDDATAVDFEEQQTLTDAQKTQARSNIGAASQDDMTSMQAAVGNVPSGSNLQDEVTELKSAITEVNSHMPVSTTEVKVGDYTAIQYMINNSTGKWTGNQNARCVIIPVGAINKITITANDDATATFALLKTNGHTANDYPDYATGCTKDMVSAGETKTVDVPNDANYLYVFKSYSTTTYSPKYIYFKTYVDVPTIDTTLTQSGKAADAKVTGDRIGAIDDMIGAIKTASFTKPASGNAVYNLPFNVVANKPISFWWIRTGTPSGTPSANFYTRLTTSGATVETLATNVYPGTIVTVTPTEDANYVRISATGDGSMFVGYTDGVDFRIVNLSADVEQTKKIIRREPLTRFDFDHLLFDTSDITDDFGLTVATRSQMMDKVYAFFGKLAEDYPRYVTEILDATDGADGETPTGLSYPWYAQYGVVAGSTHTIPVTVDGEGTVTESVDYTFTSAVSPYTVRLYKLSDTNPALPATGKKKIFITGGTHGNEVVAPINLCVLAKRLCEPTDDPDLLKLRATFDFYIIPVLDGFGAQYLSRTNGNLVDLNRNFPTNAWSKTAANFDNLATCTFSGPSAGSEFETQLVMALTEQIEPDVYVDHHNSGTGASQFYSIVTNAIVGNAIYEALTDCAYSFIHGLPAYFGTTYNLFSGSDVSPGTFTASNGHSGRWMYEHGIIPSGTCEVFEAINFLNGVYNSNPEKYTADTFKVAEYTLRNVVLHLCQFLLEH